MSFFSERLRELRQNAGLSQSDLAKQIKTSKSSVNMYERGEREPGFETMEAIADCFNVDMDYLYGRSEYKSEIKRAFDDLFSSQKPINEDVAFAFYLLHQGINDTSEFERFKKLNPNINTHATEKIHKFYTQYLSLSEESRNELNRYLDFIAQKEKENK